MREIHSQMEILISNPTFVKYICVDVYIKRTSSGECRHTWLVSTNEKRPLAEPSNEDEAPQKVFRFPRTSGH